MGLLESAVVRPFQTFGGEELYPTIVEKAAALGESLIVNHPFVDGNKRTGLAAMYALSLGNGYKPTAPSNELYNTIISISTGSLHFEQIVAWLEANTVAI